jgi:hypothetical protein
MTLCHLLERHREVGAGQSVILDYEDVRAVGEVLQALPVPRPRIRRDGGVLTYLYRERLEAL